MRKYKEIVQNCEIEKSTKKWENGGGGISTSEDVRNMRKHGKLGKYAKYGEIWEA